MVQKVKIIIAGDGKVGLTLTQRLALEGHDLTLIDSNQQVLDSSIERYDAGTGGYQKSGAFNCGNQ